MKIFIYLPNWLGDAVMAASAINNICKNYKNAKITFYGSFTACELYKELGCVIIEDKKQRLKQLRSIKQDFDIAISFKASLSSKFLLCFIKAKTKLRFNAQKSLQIHQVLKYKNLLNPLNLKDFNDNSLAFKRLKTRKLIGIAAGANYGAAKCYEPEYFAKIASEFKEYRVIIFGTKHESTICDCLEKRLKENGMKVSNLCNKTSIKKLILAVSSLEYLLANDSGIMHIGASFDIKTLAFFGPTNINQTAPYSKNAQVFSLNLACAPCMKRICPLKHHKCMKDLTPQIVLKQMR